MKSAVNIPELRILLESQAWDLHILKVHAIETSQHAPQNSPDYSLVVLVKAMLDILETEVHEWFHQLDILGSEKNEARKVTIDFLSHPKELRDDSDLNLLDLWCVLFRNRYLLNFVKYIGVNNLNEFQRLLFDLTYVIVQK